MKIKGIMVNSGSKYVLINISKSKYIMIHLIEDETTENIIKYVSENLQLVNNLIIKINYDVTLIDKNTNKSYIIKEKFIKRLEMDI
jgi:hypothetical protein